MADCRSGLGELALGSLAPSMSRAYSAVWRDWSTFLQWVGVSGKSELESILWDRFRESRSRASVSEALAGIAFFPQLRGLWDPTKSFVLAKASQGWA